MYSEGAGFGKLAGRGPALEHCTGRPPPSGFSVLVNNVRIERVSAGGRQEEGQEKNTKCIECSLGVVLKVFVNICRYISNQYVNQLGCEFQGSSTCSRR